jgi:hypothetical protein
MEARCSSETVLIFGRSGRVNCCWFRQHSHSWFRLMTIFYCLKSRADHSADIQRTTGSYVTEDITLNELMLEEWDSSLVSVSRAICVEQRAKGRQRVGGYSVEGRHFAVSPQKNGLLGFSSSYSASSPYIWSIRPIALFRLSMSSTFCLVYPDLFSFTPIPKSQLLHSSCFNPFYMFNPTWSVPSYSVIHWELPKFIPYNSYLRS